MRLLFYKWRRYHNPYDSIASLSLESILGTRERVPLILSLTNAVKQDAGRMTVEQNLRVFQQVKPVFLKYVNNHNAKILKIGPGLLNPFAFPFLFLLHGYCTQYFGVDISQFRWDFALYGLNVLIDDVIKEPLKYGFASRPDAVRSLETVIDFDALRDENVSKIFVDEKVCLFVYDGVHIDQISGDIKNIDFVWAQDVFEHFRQPRAVIERIPYVMKSDGIMYFDVDFKDHSFRDKGKDEWSLLRANTWPKSLNRLRAHEMIDDIVQKQFDIIERADTVKKIPRGRRERLAWHFRNMTEEQLSILSSRVVCKPRYIHHVVTHETGSENREHKGSPGATNRETAG